MKVIVSTSDLDYRWAGISAVCGVTGFISYIILLAVDPAAPVAIALAFAFAFGITVSSIGIYYILGGAEGPRTALIAVVSNIVAAALLLAMLTVQISVKAVVQQPDAAQKAVWLGLDAGWDLYIGAGTILFGLAMFRRRGLGVWFAVPGVFIGSLLLILNIITYPIPPVNAGFVDVGPLVGLWYLVVYVRLGVTYLLLERKQRRSVVASPR